MLRMLGRLWRKRQRQLDMKLLWPACVNRSPDVDTAKIMFAAHALHDPAWTKDLTHDQIVCTINELAESLQYVPLPHRG